MQQRILSDHKVNRQFLHVLIPVFRHLQLWCLWGSRRFVFVLQRLRIIPGVWLIHVWWHGCCVFEQQSMFFTQDLHQRALRDQHTRDRDSGAWRCVHVVEPMHRRNGELQLWRVRRSECAMHDEK